MEKSISARAMTRDGSAMIIAADTTKIVQRAREIHGLSKTMTAALGRALTAASLMGALLKSENNTLTLQFRGDGPAGTVCCVSDCFGNVRGYADNPAAELAPNSSGKLDVGGAIGRGTMYVIKDLGMEEPYVGLSDIVSGEIAEDVTHYYAKSEQVPTVCALGVRVNRDYSCKAAGGFLVQLLPFSDDATTDRLEKNISEIQSVSGLLADGMMPEQVIGKVFDGIEFDMFDSREIGYRCTCDREKYYRALLSLGKDELTRLLQEGKPVETVCSFCAAKYVFEQDEIKRMITEAKK